MQLIQDVEQNGVLAVHGRHANGIFAAPGQKGHDLSPNGFIGRLAQKMRD
jgi:hypothetical protein